MLEASTFKDKDIIQLATKNFINLKIDAETKHGIPLFNQFNGTGYPLIVFLDSYGNELDRISGYLPEYEFLIKMKNVLSGKRTFTYYLEEYNKNNHSAEILSSLASKYQEKGESNAALNLYNQLLQTSNISKQDFDNARYNIAILSIQKDNISLILEFLNDYKQYPDLENAVYELIDYYKSKSMEKEEIELYNKYIDQFNNSYSFLNSYAWRMAELNKNLNDALLKINYALNLVDAGFKQYPNILDTKAEILWKLGETDKAIKIIDVAINLEPNSQYYRNQKEKFSGRQTN
tara:strand:+ start:2180 stop:3052 length:873 start_codon:yes stop_codon:yes gene_type:complete